MTVIDWIIVIVLLSGLIVAARATRRYMRSVADFTIGGRKMGMWLGFSTAYAEGIGLISIANYCQLGFTKGFSWIWLSLAGLCITIPLFGLWGLGIERYRATQVHTLPQYFEMRYSRGVRLMAGIALGLGGVLNMAIFPIVGSRFLIAFLGLPAAFTVVGIPIETFPVILCVVLMLALFFTMLGGMVTVIITDYLQSVLIFVSILIISFLILRHTGVSHMKASLDANLGDAAFNPFDVKSLGWAFITMFILNQIIQRLAFPPALQKMSSAESPRVARLMILLSAIFGHGRIALLVLWGIAALAIFGPAIPEGQDPEIYKRVVAAIMLRDITPPIVKGVALAGFVFAFISTVDSYLLSWASVITNDVVCAFRRIRMTPIEHLRALRVTSLCIAVFIFYFGIYYKPTESIIQFMYLTGTVFSACGLITWFGLYWSRATSTGAWTCLILGTAIPAIFIPLKQKIQWMGDLDPDHVALLVTVGPAVMLVVVSLLSHKPTRFVDYGRKLKEIKAREAALRAEAKARAQRQKQEEQEQA